MVEIKRLTPELAEDYVHFFDVTPHDQFVDEHKCYCVCWCNDDYEGKDFSTVEKRRKQALEYVKNNNIQGYLVYDGDEIIGWCNANSRNDCLKCASWRYLMDYVPLIKEDLELKIKSIFCFVINPKRKRQGIATMVLNRVIDDAINEGYDIIEAYPFKDGKYQSSDFGGHIDMYKKHGFAIYLEAEKGIVMRKRLK
jgi:ribosomal protein S18 acetylase RimI-like enzyme